MKINITIWYQGIVSVLLLFSIYSCSAQPESKSTKTGLYTSGKNNNTYPAALVPFGAVQLRPQTQNNLTGTSYHYNDSIIKGFAFTSIDTNNSLQTENYKNNICFFPSTDYKQEAKFLHSYEVVKPGYYSVYMHEADIAIELTATKHCGFLRCYFPPTDCAQVIINQKLTFENDSICTGSTSSTHFIIHFSRPATNVITKATPSSRIFFDTSDEEMVYIKVAMSEKNIDDARMKLKNELPEWNFEQAVTDANQKWNEYLINE